MLVAYRCIVAEAAGNVTREQLLPLVCQGPLCNPAKWCIHRALGFQCHSLQVCKYLATIPPTLKQPLHLSDVKPLVWTPPSAPVVEDVAVRMVDERTQATLTFPVVLDRTTQEAHAARKDIALLNLACRVLETRLLRV